MNQVKDFELIKKRFNAFWNCEMEDRCLLTFVVKDKEKFSEFEAYKKRIILDHRYSDKFHLTVDPEIKIKNQVSNFNFMKYMGDTLPIIDTAIGPGMSSAFLGSRVNIDNNGIVWFEKAIDEWTEDINIEFDEKNIWWILTKSMVEWASKETKGNYLVSLCNEMYCGLDTLMHLRGSENLCMDLLLEPELIKRNCKKIVDYWKRWYDELYSILATYTTGNAVGWLKFWSPGRTYTLQCDFMNMISPQMFKEFALPDINEMANYLDYSIFHFDGPDEVVRHLPYLLDIKKLNGIQWNPKKNYENIRHIPILKKIQAAGKSLILNTTPDEIETLLTELSPKGLMLNINPFSKPFEDPQEVESIIKNVENLCQRNYK